MITIYFWPTVLGFDPGTEAEDLFEVTEQLTAILWGYSDEPKSEKEPRLKLVRRKAKV